MLNSQKSKGKFPEAKNELETKNGAHCMNCYPTGFADLANQVAYALMIP